MKNVADEGVNKSVKVAESHDTEIITSEKPSLNAVCQGILRERQLTQRFRELLKWLDTASN